MKRYEIQIQKSSWKKNHYIILVLKRIERSEQAKQMYGDKLGDIFVCIKKVHVTGKAIAKTWAKRLDEEYNK